MGGPNGDKVYNSVESRDSLESIDSYALAIPKGDFITTMALMPIEEEYGSNKL